METGHPESRGPSLTPSKTMLGPKAWSFPQLAPGTLTAGGHSSKAASTLLEALDAMKRCNSEHRFGGHSDSWVDDILGNNRRRPESPDTTLASFHSKQCSQESLESQAEEVLRAMKTSSNLTLGGPPSSLSNASAQSMSTPTANGPSAQPNQPPKQTQQTKDTEPVHAGEPVGSCQPSHSQASIPPGAAVSSSNSSHQRGGHEVHGAEQAGDPSTTGDRALPGCRSSVPPQPVPSRPLPETQQLGSDGGMDPGRAPGSVNLQPAKPRLPPNSTTQPTSHRSAPSPSTSSRSVICTPAPAMRAVGAASPAAPRASLPPTKPYLISRSHTSSPAPPPKPSALPTSAPAPAGHLTPGSFESSSSDDCEEATRRITSAFPKLHSTSHERHKSWSAFGGRGSEEAPRLLRSQEGSLDGSSGLSLSLEEAELLERRRNGRGNYHLTGPAAAELLLRLNHARQTVDFVKRQAALFSSLNRACMDVWEALDMLDAMQPAHGAQAEAALSPKDHAFQTAELCRLSHPDHDWLHLVGLIHGLGRLLLHNTFGSQPEWATLGESFPLGCRFDPSLPGAQFFSVNPDRRRRMYNSALGIYPAACGLRNVYMSWSAAEYLYLMLLLNDTRLPQEALFMIRYQRFNSLTSGNGAYRQLLSAADEALLPLLASFQQLCVERRVAMPPDKTRPREEQQQYYAGLVHKYLGQGRKLSW